MTAEANKNLLMRRVDLVNSETDQDILIKQACSDRAAFARLYRMHYERVFRYCCRKSGDTILIILVNQRSTPAP